MLLCKKKFKKIWGERLLKIRLMFWYLFFKLVGLRSCIFCDIDNWNFL